MFFIYWFVYAYFFHPCNEIVFCVNSNVIFKRHCSDPTHKRNNVRCATSFHLLSVITLSAPIFQNNSENHRPLCNWMVPFLEHFALKKYVILWTVVAFVLLLKVLECSSGYTWSKDSFSLEHWWVAWLWLTINFANICLI